LQDLTPLSLCKKTIFQDEGFCTGIEFGGEQMLVLDKDDQQTIHIKNDE
jgi:hypothetical protein